MNYRMPTVAFNVRGKDSILVAQQLQSRGILVSGGMQCVPLAHKTLNTAPEGVVRISVGTSNTQDDIERAIDALATVSQLT